MNILISCPQFHEIGNMIVNAFLKVGCEVNVSEWPSLKGTILTRTKALFYEKINFSKLTQSYMVDVLLEKTIKEYNKKLLQEIVEIHPDVLLVLKGDIILPETLSKIRDNSNVILILWCYDSALRFNNVLNGGNYYHIFYSYEPTDIKELEKHNIQAEFLPMAYDPNFYFKLENERQSIDISFVGMLNGYPERKDILENIALKNKKIDLDIWGIAWTPYNPFLQYEYKVKRRKLGKLIHNYNIPPEEVNKIYNSSRICLNIHHSQSKEGINPRTFEILGSGGFQLVDYKKKIDELFNIGQEIICYKNEKELFNNIEYYLENEDERRKIAQRGFEVVTAKHTYEHRVEIILNDIKKI